MKLIITAIDSRCHRFLRWMQMQVADIVMEGCRMSEGVGIEFLGSLLMSKVQDVWLVVVTSLLIR